MAKSTKIDNHDWVAVRTTFADGTKANVTWNRGGENVVVTPNDPKGAEALSLVVMGAMARMRTKDPAYPHANVGKIADAMVGAGQAAKTLDDYVAKLKVDLMVTGERPKSDRPAPSETTATLKASRGWHLQVNFKSGDRMLLKLNRSSVGAVLEPHIPSKIDEILKLAFAAKQSGVLDEDTLAEKAKEVALASDDLDEWIEGFRNEVFPQPGMRR